MRAVVHHVASNTAFFYVCLTGLVLLEAGAAENEGNASEDDDRPAGMPKDPIHSVIR